MGDRSPDRAGRLNRKHEIDRDKGQAARIRSSIVFEAAAAVKAGPLGPPLTRLKALTGTAPSNQSAAIG